LDTNVLIAAFVARGLCTELLEHCERTHDLVTSEFILGEFEDNLLQKFKVPALDAKEAKELLASHMACVTPQPLETPICRDPDDDWVLSTAIAGACSCIVTGDKDLLSLGMYENIQIIPPGAFWSFEAARHVP